MKFIKEWNDINEILDNTIYYYSYLMKSLSQNKLAYNFIWIYKYYKKEVVLINKDEISNYGKIRKDNKYLKPKEQVNYFAITIYDKKFAQKIF